MSRKLPGRRNVAAAVALVSVLAFAGCRGSGDPQASDFGTKHPTGAPVVVGVLSVTSGPAAFPDTAEGAKAAQYYVNRVLGGIKGRPLRLDICGTDGTPEKGIACANKFVAEHAAAVVDGYDSTVGAAQPVLQSAGIPLTSTIGGSGTIDSAPYGSVFTWGGPSAGAALATIKLIQLVGAKTASFAVTDSSATHTYVDDAIDPIAKKVGIDVEVQYVPSSGANYSVLAATQVSENPGISGNIVLSEDGCAALYQAVRQQGFSGPFYAGSCSEFIDKLGGQAEGVVVKPILWPYNSRDHAPARIKKQLEDFGKAMEAVGAEDELTTKALWTFAGVVNTAQAMDQISGKTIDATSTTEALKSLKDFQTFAGPVDTCDGKTWPGIPTSCTKQAILFEVQDDGTLKPLDDAGYVDLDLSLVDNS
jgi:branched-chain amino acid transport system substrate-binding protein